VVKLPVISGRELIKVLQKFGFQVKRQKGSHVLLKKDELRVTVPIHKTIQKGTLIAILRQSELQREDLF
jgi:predicted RNA binding protein YcfA (HicA-like mRNA interferase family)